jgi:hypothetical protein
MTEYDHPMSSRRAPGIAVTRNGGGGGLQVQARKKKLAKWTCHGSCASAWVACGTDLHAVCLTCGSEFYRVPAMDAKD